MFADIKKFFEDYKTKLVMRDTQKRFAEMYDAEQLEEMYSEFKKSAQKILADVLIPYINEQKRTYRGAKAIVVSVFMYIDDTYKIASQYDSYFHKYEYPNSKLDHNGVWQTALKLAQEYGLRGKCDTDDFGINYYFEWKKVT